jgi:hypothetical protein
MKDPEPNLEVDALPVADAPLSDVRVPTGLTAAEPGPNEPISSAPRVAPHRLATTGPYPPRPSGSSPTGYDRASPATRATRSRTRCSSTRRRRAKTHAQVATDHGMTEGAFKSRIRALKTKYEPQWRRRQRTFILFLLAGVAAAIAAFAWLLWPSHQAQHGEATM